MSTSTTEARAAFALAASITEDTLTVDLNDGRSISVPLAWYPRLLHGTVAERNHWRLIGQGEGLHWPDLDEDIRVQNLLDGRPSGESQRSLRAWIEQRAGQAHPRSSQASILPEELETITISSLMEDETVYVTAWSIVADLEGRLWIQGDGSFTRQPRGTSHVQITRMGDSVVVDRGTIGDHTYERQPVLDRDGMLPVILK